MFSKGRKNSMCLRLPDLPSPSTVFILSQTLPMQWQRWPPLALAYIFSASQLQWKKSASFSNSPSAVLTDAPWTKDLILNQTLWLWLAKSGSYNHSGSRIGVRSSPPEQNGKSGTWMDSQRTIWHWGRKKERCIGKNKFPQRLGAPLLVSPTLKALPSE